MFIGPGLGLCCAKHFPKQVLLQWTVKYCSNIVHYHFTFWSKIFSLGRSPGLVVMGGDSCCEFESWHCMLDGNFFTFICCNCNVCLKRRKEMKRGRDGPFLKKIFSFQSLYILLPSIPLIILAYFPLLGIELGADIMK